MLERERPWASGGCHCGAVRFRVRLPELREVLDCNCSICTKKAFLHLIVPPEAFVLEQGEEALALYAWGTGVARHRFCRICGCHPFYTPRSHPDQVDVNLRCLEDQVRATFSVRAFDGRNWEKSVGALRREGPG
jgi:hypothetical protein